MSILRLRFEILRPSVCQLRVAMPIFKANIRSRTWGRSGCNSGKAVLRAGFETTASQSRGMSTEAAVVYVTVPDMAVGKSLATSIVTQKLAACVNIIPGLTSVYLWKGEVNTDAELLLMIKTRASLVQHLTSHVKANHPYDECEVISVPITGGSTSYLKWLLDSTQQATD